MVRVRVTVRMSRGMNVGWEARLVSRDAMCRHCGLSEGAGNPE